LNETAPPTVSGTITKSASASDNAIVVQCTPYPLSWDAATASDGLHTLTAVARDTVGNVTIASGASVTVANSTGSIIAQPNGASLTNETEVTVQATSSIGPNTIQIYSDSSLIGTVSCTGNSCSDTVDWHTNGLAAGPHSLYAVATATFGNSGSSMAFTVFK
jgi:hypothetical protein